MTNYCVTSIDSSASGYERLRTSSEVILLAYPNSGDTIATIVDEWSRDLDNCSREDGFDFAAARREIREFAEMHEREIQYHIDNVNEAMHDSSCDDLDLECDFAIRLYLEKI